MIVVMKGSSMMHVPAVSALQVRDALQSELASSSPAHTSAHRRLIAGHAVVRQLDLIAVQIIDRDHFTACLPPPCGIFPSRPFRRKVNSRSSVALFMFDLVGFPVAPRELQFLERSAPPPGRACGHHGRIATLSITATKNLHQAFHRSFSLMNLSDSQITDHIENPCSSAQRGRFAFPCRNLCRESYNSAQQHARNH